MSFFDFAAGLAGSGSSHVTVLYKSKTPDSLKHHKVMARSHFSTPALHFLKLCVVSAAGFLVFLLCSELD